MATRRRGAASLDDLKAKLGYAEASDTPESAAGGGAEESGEQAAAESGEAGTVEAGEQPAPVAAAAPKPAPAPVKPAPSLDQEDYSEAVSHVDGHHTYELDPNAVDPTIEAPASKSLVATLIAAVAALLVGVVLGGIGVANNTVREFENATIADAQAVIQVVQPVAAKLTALDAAIASIPADEHYSPEFEERLRADYADARPILDPALVANAKTLMVRNETLGRQLVDYAVATTFLGSLVDRHLRATTADADEIARLQSGLEDQANYAIAIEFETLLGRFQAFVQDPVANPFQPIAAERVTYENLDIVERGEGDAQREYYRVTTATGQNIEVLIHDLVMLPRDQLLPPVSNENALDRYRARANQIKELVASAVTMQSALLSGLEETANKSTYFTF